MASGRKQRVTQRQIAEATGFAPITVSKALRNERDIAEETRQVIQSKAIEMGYLQNVAASSLRTGKSMMIAVSVIDILNPFWSAFCKKIERLALEKGYIAVFMNANPDSAREQQEIGMMIQHGVDGLLIDPSVDCSETIAMLKRMDIPCVLVGWSGESYYCDSVLFDLEEEGYMMGKYLMSKSIHRLLFMEIPEPYVSYGNRLYGLKRALAEAHFPFENVVLGRMSSVGQGASEEVMSRYFGDYPDIDAIYAFSDYSALQLLSSLPKIGKRVPEDVIVVSNDGIQQLLETGTRLTSIDCSPYRMANAAFRLLMRRIEGDDVGFPETQILPVQLVEGETS